jgi:epoxyqueuosine reductase
MNLENVTETSRAIREMAAALGVDAVGFARAVRLDGDALRLQDWLNSGYHADMAWMEGHFEKRVDPALLVEGTKSVVVALFSYKPAEVQSSNLPQIAKYAYGTDYHIVVKDRLWELLKAIQKKYPEVEGRPFVDSAPVMERAWAVRAGLGWIGKNSLLLNKDLGSFFFIGTLMLNVELDYATPLKSSCGGCTRCIEACPTRAIVWPKVVDARKCISYHTIENRGIIPDSIKPLIGNRVFGCDTCQDVCPWNVRVAPHNHQELAPRQAILSSSLEDWTTLNEDRFAEIFRKSAVKRTKYSGFTRNMQIVVENQASSRIDKCE